MITSRFIFVKSKEYDFLSDPSRNFVNTYFNVGGSDLLRSKKT